MGLFDAQLVVQSIQGVEALDLAHPKPANMVGAFWLGIAGYFGLLAFFISANLQDGRLFQKNEILFAVLLANGIAGVLVLVPGGLLAMWPYAVAS